MVGEMTEISVESVCEFITSRGGKVKNITLVFNFKKLLNDPATRDEARQQFKECVNTVAVVKTENGEKYVQLKKKYRSPSSSTLSSTDGIDGVGKSTPEVSRQPTPEVSRHPTPEVSRHPTPEVSRHSTPEVAKHRRGDKKSPKPEPDDLNTSYTPQEDVPFADGSLEHSPRKSHDSSKHKKKSKKSSPDHQVAGSNPAQSSKTAKETETSNQRQSKEKSPQLRKEQTVPRVEKPVETVEIEKVESLESYLQLPTVVAPPGEGEFAVPSVPRRKKKDRKENVPPSPSLEHRGHNSIERVKAALQTNTSEQGRITRARPASIMQTSYVGSVERARQNFQSKSRNGDDSSSVAMSEKSIDSKGDNEQDDDYDRYPPSVSLSVAEKSWILKSCQGDMVGMRKLLDGDGTLLEKKDFVLGYTAMHWAAKKGNKDMLHMLLDLKAEVNIRSNGGYTPLHLATMNGHEDVLIALLQHDANPKMRDYSGRLPIHYLKGDMSLPLQKKLFGENQTLLKGFAAGLRQHDPDSSRKSKRISSAISGGLSSVGALMSRSSEDLSKLDEPNRPSRSGSFRSKMSRKKHLKSGKERPTITLVTADDGDSGFGSTRGSVMSLPMSSSTPNLKRSNTGTPNPLPSREDRARSHTSGDVV